MYFRSICISYLDADIFCVRLVKIYKVWPLLNPERRVIPDIGSSKQIYCFFSCIEILHFSAGEGR